MKYQKVIIFSLAIIIIEAALYYVVSNRTTLFNTSPENVSKQVKQTALETQSVTIGIVIYKVTPKILTPTSETWDFEVNLNTHTGSLDQDLVSTILLVDDKGNEYKPTKWTGDPLGGHHREGILEFLPVVPRPSSIKFNIQTTDTTGKNSLRWNI